ncbi:MAG: hypothetical protein RR107_04810, partial [Clostridia bacterium]
MRKIICFILILCLIISTPLGLSTATATTEADEEYFSYDFAPVDEKYSSINYYEFKNPIKIASSKKYIAVLDYDKEAKTTTLVGFDTSGKLLSKTVFSDPRDLEVIDGIAYVLDYDLSNETPTAHIYAVDIKLGTSVVALNDVSVKDLTSYGNYLYALNIGLVQGVKRYTSTASGLIHDTSFSDNNLFANATSITASANYILGYQSNIGIPTIFAVNLKDDKKTDVTALPSGGLKEFLFDGTNLYILNEKGVFVGVLGSAPDFVPAMLNDTVNTSSSENLINPVSFSLDKSNSNSLYILDGLNALAIKKFRYSSKILTSSMFSIGSFSSDKGAFNTPSDICYSNDKTFYADTLNNRVVMVTKSGKTTEFMTVDENNKPISPKLVGVDYSSNIYVTTDKTVYKYSSTYKLINSYSYADDRKLSDLTALYVSDVSDEVYAIDGSRLIKLNSKTDSFNIIKPSGASSKALAIDMRFQRAITANESSVYIYDLKTFERIQTVQVGDNSTYVISDLTTDFEGNIYALVGNKTFTYIFKLSVNKKGRYEPVGQVRLGSDRTYKALAVDNTNSQLFLLPTSEHRSYSLDKEVYRSLKITYYDALDITINIFDKKYDENATVGTVIDSENKMIFPLNFRDELYPVNYAITRARKLNTDEKVVVAGYSLDKKYAYVICNNAAGFMDVNALTVSDQLTDMPFKQGVALHENMYVYKYPLVTVYDLIPLYSVDQIEKDTKLTLLNKA